MGGALIRQITDRCDRIGLPCYLESSKDVNVPYYQRFGFEVTGETRPRQGRPHHLVHVARPAGPRVGLS